DVETLHRFGRYKYIWGGLLLKACCLDDNRVPARRKPRDTVEPRVAGHSLAIDSCRLVGNSNGRTRNNCASFICDRAFHTGSVLSPSGGDGKKQHSNQE